MPARPKVLITDHAWPDLEVERGVLAAVNAEIVDAPASDENTLAALAAGVDAIGTCWAPVTEEIIAAAPRCRVIGKFGTGLDNVAVAAATARGIAVANVPDYCVDEVSDHTMALLLACVRTIATHDRRTKCSVYDLHAAPTPRRLRGCTLGLLGFGRIARAVFHKAIPFGMNVVASTPSSIDYGTGCRMVGMEQLLAASDILSLHLPLNAATHHILDEAAFRKLKPGALVINTSRGGLIDHQALQTALADGRVSAIGLDVFDPEPPDLSEPLFRDERVIATPHAAFLSTESLMELRTRAAGNIADVLSGKRPHNLVNPEVWNAR